MKKCPKCGQTGPDSLALEHTATCPEAEAVQLDNIEPIEPLLLAWQTCIAALRPLTFEEQQRVLRSAAILLGFDE